MISFYMDVGSKLGIGIFNMLNIKLKLTNFYKKTELEQIQITTDILNMIDAKVFDKYIEPQIFQKIREHVVNIFNIIDTTSSINAQLIYSIFEIFKTCNNPIRKILEKITQNNSLKENKDFSNHIVVLSDILKYLNILDKNLSDDDIKTIKNNIINIIRSESITDEKSAQYVISICKIFVSKVMKDVKAIRNNEEHDKFLHDIIIKYLTKMEALTTENAEEDSDEHYDDGTDLTTRAINKLKSLIAWANIIKDLMKDKENYRQIGQEWIDRNYNTNEKCYDFMQNLSENEENVLYHNKIIPWFIHYEQIKSINKKLSILSAMAKTQKLSECVHVITKHKTLFNDLYPMFDTYVLLLNNTNNNSISYLLSKRHQIITQNIEMDELVQFEGIYHNDKCMIKRRYNSFVITRIKPHELLRDYSFPVYETINTITINSEGCTMNLNNNVLELYLFERLLCSINTETGFVLIHTKLKTSKDIPIQPFVLNNDSLCNKKTFKLLAKDYNDEKILQDVFKQKIPKTQKDVDEKWNKYISAISNNVKIIYRNMYLDEFKQRYLFISCTEKTKKILSEEPIEILSKEDLLEQNRNGLYYYIHKDKSIIVQKTGSAFTLLYFELYDIESDYRFIETNVKKLNSYNDLVSEIDIYIKHDDQMSDDMDSNPEQNTSNKNKNTSSKIYESENEGSDSVQDGYQAMNSNIGTTNNSRPDNKLEDYVRKSNEIQPKNTSKIVFICVCICIFTLSLLYYEMSNTSTDTLDESTDINELNTSTNIAENMITEHSTN